MTIDKKKIEEATRLLLTAIGDNYEREGLIETPKRVANMYADILNGYEKTAEKHLKIFNEPGAKDMVIVKDIPFYSFCEHHLVPFFGKIHIGYIPDGKIVGLSKLIRMARVYAKRPQVQERLTKQIADALMKLSDDVMVYIEAEHMCMSMRGVRTPGTTTITSAVRGKFLNPPENKNPKEEFLFAINKK